MYRSARLLPLLGLLLFACGQSDTTTTELPDNPTYRDAAADVDARLDDLIGYMSVEEKVAQMLCIWQVKGEQLTNEDNSLKVDSLRKNFPYGMGQVARPSDANGGLGARENAELCNRIQRYFTENTRLGIPVTFHEECLHGFAAKDGTSFPQPIALAGTFDPKLVEEIFTLTAKEARLRGAHQALSPVLDICRDPRWGRVEETYGEDPYLAGEIGKAAVRGFQGDRDYANNEHLMATLKHLTGHGVPEGGNNISPAQISERVLREVFLYPFKEVIAAEKPMAVMASYNEIDGVPSHASKYMLREMLREDMGFEGYVVSDYFAIRELNERAGTASHHLARNAEEAAKLAVEAGVNIELPDPDCYPSLVELVRAGSVPESRLDEMIRPMLRAKFDMGLFDDPYVDPDEAAAFSGREANRALARRAAADAIVLLQNTNNRLPLAAGQRIAVIGPNADRSLLGGYSGTPTYEESVLDGIRTAYGADRVTYAPGCYITTTEGWGNDSVGFATPEQDRRMIAEAVRAARRSDVVVLAIGGNEQTSREAWATGHLGDRTSLKLLGAQDVLVDALAATGKPIIALVFGGRPLNIQNVLDDCDAVLQCWYLGQETGGGVADVLTGTVNPGGKLAISMPRSAGHIPAYYAHKPSDRRGYLADDVSALFPFGYGGSYTTFAVAAPTLADTQIPLDGSTTVSATVTNTGSRRGSEVVQLYIRDLYSSVTRPVRELRGFRKVLLEPGERQTVSFDITPKHLQFYNIDKNLVVEPGDFEIYVGTSSRPRDLQQVRLRVGDAGLADR